MSLWGTGSSLYYTGSSDGSIRAWDVRRHPQDVLVHNVAQLGAGIQSGAFSPDGTHLLVGDATGGIHVLSSAPWEPLPNEDCQKERRYEGAPIDIIRAWDGSGRVIGGDDNPGTLGIEAGMDLLLTEQLTLNREYGPGKGPNYDGPYALKDRQEKEDSNIGRLNKEVYRQQPFSRNGKPRPERAEPIRILAAARRELLDKGHDHNVEFFKVDPKASKTTVKEAADLTPRGKTGLTEAKLSSSGAMQALNKDFGRPSQLADALLQGNKKASQTPTPPPSFNGQSNPLSPPSHLSPPQRERNTMLKYLSNPPEPQKAFTAINSKSASRKPPAMIGPRPIGPSKQFAVRSQLSPGVIDNLIPEHEMVEANGWWPGLGEQEIAKARERPRLRG